jgi:serine/threonine protein kinase
MKNKEEAKLNQVKNRLLFLSPTVREGIERECNKDDFEAIEDKALGKGGFGHVWKVKHKLTKKIYAIKVINKDYILKENMVEQINREIEIMYKTDHPHIIKLYNHYEDDDNFYLIMHCASKGQLYSQLKRLKRLDERTVAQYLRELISAVKYIHSMNPPIIHRDIKPENILIDGEGRAKLADFGWSNFYEDNKKRETYCGTPEYLAPEMVMKQGHNEKIDIWSIGVLMFELLAGRPPFVYKGDTNKLYNDIKSLRIQWTDDFPMLAKNLITKILKLKPDDRPSLEEMIAHPWFQENETIRPVLDAYGYDPAAKLRSHLINCLPNDEEDVDNKIKTLLLQKRESIKNPASSLSDIEQKLDSEIKMKNQEISFLREELSKKDKQIVDLKVQMEKISSDETTFKIRDQERESLIVEIDSKSKRLLETEAQLNLLKSEFDQLSQKYKILKDENEDNIKNLHQYEKLNQELSQKASSIEQEKQQLIIDFEKKIRIIQIDSIKDSDQEKDFEMTAGLIHKELEEIRVILENKVEKLSQRLIIQDKNEVEFRANLLEINDNKIKELVKNFKDSHDRIITEEKNFYKKQIDDISNSNAKVSKALDWYKSQILELHGFKQKCVTLESTVNKLKEDLKILSEKTNTNSEKNSILEKLTSNQQDYIQKLADSKEKFKNAFLESEKIFQRYVTNKKLRDLINFNEYLD